MSYNLAYSVLTPLTNGETGLQLRQHDPRFLDEWFGVVPDTGLPSTNLFGLEMSGYPGFYFCAVILIIGFFLAMRIFRSPFGHDAERRSSPTRTRMQLHRLQYPALCCWRPSSFPACTPGSRAG